MWTRRRLPAYAKLLITTDVARKPSWVDFHRGVEEASEHFTRVPTRADETMLIYFTSGTTGMPKMVAHDYLYALSHVVTARRSGTGWIPTGCTLRCPTPAGARRHGESWLEPVDGGDLHNGI